MKQLKIAFGYKMGTGKDEACNFLIKKFGGTKISFSSPIYDIQKYAQERSGFKLEKDRKFLQYIGTEWARIKNPDVWVNLALNNVKNEGNFFISDLRFHNEFERLKKDGWFCVKLLRSKREEGRNGTGSYFHRSESALDNIPEDRWDAIIYNDNRIKDFYDQIDILVNNIMKK